MSDLEPTRLRREDTAGAAPPRNPGRVGLPLLAVALLAVAAGTVATWRSSSGDVPSVGARGTPLSLSQLTFSNELEEFPAFSADGSLLVYSREVAGYRQIFVRDVATGAEQQVTADAVDHIQPALSPDARTLLYVQAAAPRTKLEPDEVFGQYQAGDVWRLDLESRRAQRLIREAFNPSYSPDGRAIALDASWSGPRRVWVTDALGRNPAQATTDASEAVTHVRPRWSPDGARLAFQSIEKTKLDVRVVDVGTGATTSLTDDPFIDVDPVWTPAGDQIVFSSYRGGGLNLWSVRVAGDGRAAGAPRQITTGAGQDVQAAVAPDGRLAFVTLNLNADVWRLPVDPRTGRPTSAPEPLIATTRHESRGAWSPDGSAVAFNSDRGGEMNLWLYSLAERRTRQLTHGPGGDFQPHWSPEGRRLVFFSSRSGNADIWKVDVESGELTQLTTDPALDVNPFWSPDGRRIAFQSDRGGRREVWVMEADGSGQSRFYAGVASSGHISFSPDSTLIAGVAGGHKWLMVTPVAGGEPVKVFEFEDPEIRIDYPVWSPDGRWILLDLTKPTGGDIWEARVLD